MSFAKLFCQFGSAVAAFIAAWFWYRSAQESAPPPPMTWEGIGDLKPWLDSTMRQNRNAAIFAGLSALLAGISLLLDLFDRQ